MTSVTTIEEINMGFELAILAGQEAMLEESSEEGINLVPHTQTPVVTGVKADTLRFLCDVNIVLFGLTLHITLY
jgi:hypothetical protein